MLQKTELVLAEISDFLRSENIPSYLRGRAINIAKELALVSERLTTESLFAIVALIGGNNAGKSTLFTKLTGSNSSPPAIKGGFTKRLTAAGTSQTIASLEKDPVVRSVFRLVRVEGNHADAVADQGEINTLHLVESTRAPNHLVIIDTPDVDSTNSNNRQTTDSNSFIEILDLVVCVITPSTTTSQPVLEVLKHALKHDRPYGVVVNYILEEDLVKDYVNEFVEFVEQQQLGQLPLWSCWAMSDKAVTRDPYAIRVSQLLDNGSTARSLFTTAMTQEDVQQVLLRARRTQVKAVAERLRDLKRDVEKHSLAADNFLKAARQAAEHFGQEIAKKTFPKSLLFDAFLKELNRRNKKHAWVRVPALKVADGTLWTSRKIFRFVQWAAKQLEKEAPTTVNPIIEERQPIPPAFLVFIKALDDKVRVTSDLPDELKQNLDRDLDQYRAICDVLVREISKNVIPPDDYRKKCESLIKDHLDKQSSDTLYQWGTTLATLLPAIGAVAASIWAPGSTEVAGATAGATGAMAAAGATAAGSQIAGTAATLGALMTPLFAKLSELVGSNLVSKAHEEWIKSRSELIADIAINITLSEVMAPLTTLAQSNTLLESVHKHSMHLDKFVEALNRDN